MSTVPKVKRQINVELAQPLAEFLDSFLSFTRIKPEDFWQRAIIADIKALLDDSSAFCGWTDRHQLIEKYGLKEVLQDG
jgi:hypothetical protein